MYLMLSNSYEVYALYLRLRWPVPGRDMQAGVVVVVDGVDVSSALDQQPDGVERRELANWVPSHGGALPGAGEVEEAAAVAAARLQPEEVVDGLLHAADLLWTEVGHQLGEEADLVGNRSFLKNLPKTILYSLY